MPQASYSLRKAILAALNADAALTTLLGGAKAFDQPPRGTALPYITCGDIRERDWSTATDTGAEHAIELIIWSDYQGSKEIDDITERMRAVLHLASLTLSGHRLINLRHLETLTEPAREAKTPRSARMKLRAVTEKI